MHLVIDGYSGDPERMQDTELLRSFLGNYPANLKMNRISEPQVVEYRGPKWEDWGLSGFVIIAESHISIHTFPHRSYVNVDIFSCKAFDQTQAIEDVKALFALAEVKIWLLERGLEYHDSKVALNALMQERAALSSPQRPLR